MTDTDTLYDFSTPFMAATLITPDNKRIPLWTNTNDDGSVSSVGETAQAETGVASLPYVTSIELSMDWSNIPIITVTFQPPYREAIKFLNSNVFEWGRGGIEVQFGYIRGGKLGIHSPRYTGLLLKPDVSIGPEITIIMHAQGLFSLHSERNISRQGIKKRDLLLEIIDGHDKSNPRKGDNTQDPGKIEVDFTAVDSEGPDPTASPATPTQPTAKQLWDQVVTSFIPSQRTDWELIRLLCDECRSFMLFINGKLVIKPRAKLFSSAPTRILSIMDYPYGNLGPATPTDTGISGETIGVFPVWSVSTPNTAIYLPGIIDTLVNNGVNSSDKTVKTSFYDQTTVTPFRVGPGGTAFKGSAATPTPNKDKQDGTHFAYGDPNDKSRDNLTVAHYEMITDRMGIEITIDTIGIPDLQPADVIALRGASKRLNGNYAVKQVNHTLSSSGFMTQILAISNGAKVDPSLTTDQASNANNKDPANAGSVDKQPINGGVSGPR